MEGGHSKGRAQWRKDPESKNNRRDGGRAFQREGPVVTRN